VPFQPENAPTYLGPTTGLFESPDTDAHAGWFSSNPAHKHNPLNHPDGRPFVPADPRLNAYSDHRTISGDNMWSLLSADGDIVGNMRDMAVFPLFTNDASGRKAESAQFNGCNGGGLATYSDGQVMSFGAAYKKGAKLDWASAKVSETFLVYGSVAAEAVGHPARWVFDNHNGLTQEERINAQPIAQLRCNEDSCAARMEDGSLVVYGKPGAGATEELTYGKCFRELFAGNDAAFGGILCDNTVFVWGDNSNADATVQADIMATMPDRFKDPATSDALFIHFGNRFAFIEAPDGLHLVSTDPTNTYMPTGMEDAFKGKLRAFYGGEYMTNGADPRVMTVAVFEDGHAAAFMRSGINMEDWAELGINLAGGPLASGVVDVACTQNTCAVTKEDKTVVFIDEKKAVGSTLPRWQEPYASAGWAEANAVKSYKTKNEMINYAWWTNPTVELTTAGIDNAFEFEPSHTLAKAGYDENTKFDAMYSAESAYLGIKEDGSFWGYSGSLQNGGWMATMPAWMLEPGAASGLKQVISGDTFLLIFDVDEEERRAVDLTTTKLSAKESGLVSWGHALSYQSDGAVSFLAEMRGRKAKCAVPHDHGFLIVAETERGTNAVHPFV